MSKSLTIDLPSTPPRVKPSRRRIKVPPFRQRIFTSDSSKVFTSFIVSFAIVVIIEPEYTATHESYTEIYGIEDWEGLFVASISLEEKDEARGLIFCVGGHIMTLTGAPEGIFEFRI